ncbi:DUF4112 domain-containing protein [Novipirellula sp. SH528]|uniref:DUF4112 domain-containing protein n=1 Tax=Novipirellula sp. SH528 TaxID=3454466 RepID=UPI003F9F1502
MPNANNNDPSQNPDLEKLYRFASMLDDRFRIPGTQVRFGLDSLIGLIPGIGDAATALSHGYLFWNAFKLGVRKRVFWKMLFNALLDLFGGAIPVVGDIFDVYWKSNRRNANLITQDLQKQGRSGGGRTPKN